MAQLRKPPGSIPLTHCMSLSCDAFSEALICWRAGNACTVGFSIRNPLAGDSMQRAATGSMEEGV
jgi:hypothetical protein